MTVELEGRPITPPGRQGRVLLAYLVANRHRQVRRDELIDMLWPDAPPSDPESGLNTALSRLRHELGEEVLPKGHEPRLRLPDDAWVDLEVIEERAQRTLQALEEGSADTAVRLADEALGLMQGELLPGLEGSWIDDRRRELAELRLSVREASVEASLQLGGGRLRRAKGAAQALVDEAPYHESGYELLMRVHAARGDVAEAVRVYHSLRVLLRDELGTTPGPAITELNDRLLQRQEVGDVAGAGPSGRGPGGPPEESALPALLRAVPDEPFVGRHGVLERLWERWHTVSFRPRVVALTGAAGIGKTRLAACFCRKVHEAGGTVLYGRCDEDPLTSYQPVVEALDHYGRTHDLVRELPDEADQLLRLPGLRRRLGGGAVSGGVEVTADRYALFEAIVAVFRHAAGPRPLVVVIDDAHWADAPTFNLMLHLVRSLEPPRSMFLVTFRETDASLPVAPSGDGHRSLEARLAALRREADLERVRVEGLDEKETAALITARRGSAPTEPFARDLRARTGGNPFFIQETLRSLADQLTGEDEPDLGRLGVPAGVEEMIIRRLDHLSASARKVIARAAVVGAEFRLSLLDAILDVSPEIVLEAVEELVAARLVVEVPGRPDHFVFSHALVRETQYDRLIGSRRLRIHERIARELERQVARSASGWDVTTPAELAHHFYEALPLVDSDDAARYSIEAAVHAQRSGAHEEAIGHYERALEVLDAAGAEELRIYDVLLPLGKAQLRAGRLEDARESFGRAAEIARRKGAVDRLARAALGYHGMYTAAGEVDRKRIDLLEEARIALGGDDSALLARVLARLADSLLWASSDRALELSGEAVAMARRVGDTAATLEALAGRHAAMLHAEHLEERLALSRERVDIATRAGNREAEAAALRWYMHDLCERGEVRAAKRQHARLAELARELRQPQYASYARNWSCVFAQLHGRLAEAERLADEAFELAKRAGARDAEMSHLDKRFSIYREQGRLLELRPAVERFVAEAPEITAWSALLALMDAEAGNPARAGEQLSRLVADGAAAVHRDVLWLNVIAALTETCALLDDAADTATALYAMLLPYADHFVQVGMDTFWGSASRFLGLAATTGGDWNAADRHFADAEKRNEEIESPPLVARTRVDHAEMLLRRGGRTDDALRLLAQATAVAEPLGMVNLTERASRLRARAGRRTALA